MPALLPRKERGASLSQARAGAGGRGFSARFFKSKSFVWGVLRKKGCRSASLFVYEHGRTGKERPPAFSRANQEHKKIKKEKNKNEN